MPLTSKASVKTWPELALDLRVGLENMATDDIELRIPVRGEISAHLPDFVMHVTYVQVSPTDVENWIVAFTSKQAVLDDLLPTKPVTLSDGLHFPFRDPPKTCVETMPLVWRSRSPLQAETRLLEILQERLRIDPGRVRVSMTDCTPLELDRRLHISSVVNRLQSRHEHRPLAGAACDRCGQPLYDRESVRLGIGPECRKHYSPEIISAVKNGTADSQQRSGVALNDWVALLRGWVPQS